MGTRLTLALSIYLLYTIRSFDCLDGVAVDADKETMAQDLPVETPIRAKRHLSSQSRVSLIEPPSLHKRASEEHANHDILFSGYEFDNQEAAKNDTKEKSDAPEETSSEAPEEDKEEIISPLVLYMIIAGIILMVIALLVIGIAVLYIICTLPANDTNEDDCGKGNARNPSLTPSFSRCPSVRSKADDPRYSEQSVDLVHKSRGSSLSRQSSCRICPRPGKSGGRASCASTGTNSSGGSDGSAAVAATTAGKRDYFVSCVCDLPVEDEYSPAPSTTTTFGRC